MWFFYLWLVRINERFHQHLVFAYSWRKRFRYWFGKYFHFSRLQPKRTFQLYPSWYMQRPKAHNCSFWPVIGCVSVDIRTTPVLCSSSAESLVFYTIFTSSIILYSKYYQAHQFIHIYRCKILSVISIRRCCSCTVYQRFRLPAVCAALRSSCSHIQPHPTYDSMIFLLKMYAN